MARAINRYDQPAQAQFMNTYVPIPFEEMLAAGKAKQDRYDKASMAVDSSIAAVDDILAIPNSQDEVRAKQYSDNLRSIRDKYISKDLSDPFVLREMSNEINRSIDKQDIQHIQQSRVGWEQYNKMLGQYEAEGYPSPGFEKTDFTGYSSKDTGVFTGTPRKQLNVYEDTRKFFEDIPNTYLGIKDLGYGRKGLMHGKTKDRIVSHAENNIDAFMALPSVQQYIKGVRYYGDDQGRSNEEIALQYVKDHADEFRGENVTSTFDDPGYGQESSGSRREPEVQNIYGTDDTEPVSKRKIEQIKKELSTAISKAEDEETAQRLSNELKNIELVEQEAVAPYEEKINNLGSQQQLLLKSTIENLISTGLTEEQAIEYVTAEVDPNLPSDEILAGNLENVLKGLGRGAKRIGLAFQSMPSAEREQRIREIKSSRFDLSQRQIIANFKGDLDKISTEIGDQEKAKEKERVKAVNKITPSQQTYTIINDVFDIKDGRVSGSYIGETGTRREYPSAMAQKITDFMFNPQHYQSTVEVNDGKSNRKLKLKDLAPAMASASGIKILTINNAPTESGKAVVTLQLMGEKDGKSGPISHRIKMEYPLDTDRDVEQVTNDLLYRGKSTLAFDLITTNHIKNVVEGKPLFSQDVTEISLSELGEEGSSEENKVIIEKISPTKFRPTMIYNGEERVGASTDYNNIAGSVKSLLNYFATLL